jgi:hypothetical protein
MSVPRTFTSANVMLRKYASRPGFATAAGIGLTELSGLNAARRPLMGFFQGQVRDDAERHAYDYSAPSVMSYDRPYPTYPQTGVGTPPEFYNRRSSQGATTGFDYRPFSEPERQPDDY